MKINKVEWTGFTKLKFKETGSKKQSWKKQVSASKKFEETDSS